MSRSETFDPEYLDAVIFDLDGVITDTAVVHARAWKQMFDEYLQRRAGDGEHFVPCSIDRDYPRYIDGKPRYDGVRSFLKSRGIELPEGRPDDPPTAETVCGLGNRKNVLFHELIDREGVGVFEDAVVQLQHWRSLGLRTAVVSSSKNCAAILKGAGLSHLFETRVDGAIAQQLGLPGKPAPDMFLLAARNLGVEPARAAVFEDAVSGVQAARAGGFGLVVGVDRRNEGESLLYNGADVVVQNLLELQEAGAR
jgi:beta-phosphoglucomutase family hydrolase